MIKYLKIADDLNSRIEKGDFSPNNQLPTEELLAKEYACGRNTIRRATNILLEKGLVYSVQGSGMYVRKSSFDDAIAVGSIKGVHGEFRNRGVSTRVIRFELRSANKRISEELQCAVGTPVYQIERLRLLDGVPFTIERSLYNKNVIPFLSQEIVEGGIYEYIENDLKFKIGFADKYVTAEKLTLNDSGLLNLEEGDPTLVIREKIFLSNGSLFNSSTVIHNYQMARLFINATNL